MGGFLDNINPGDKVFEILISKVATDKELILEGLYNQSLKYIQDIKDIDFIVQGIDKAIVEFIKEYNTQQVLISKMWKDLVGVKY